MLQLCWFKNKSSEQLLHQEFFTHSKKHSTYPCPAHMHCLPPHAAPPVPPMCAVLQEPEQYCSEATAAAMAEAAYRRAAQLAPLGTPIVGIGATCALATVRRIGRMGSGASSQGLFS